MKQIFAFTIVCLALLASVRADDAIRVLVWDEQQPKQAKAYDNFLGNEIAEYLKKRPGLDVRSNNINVFDQGLSKEALDHAQVLVWWGHVRHSEISTEKAKDIVARIKRGQLSMIALHSAHWAEPFVEAMRERTKMDFAKKFAANEGESYEGESYEVEYRLPEKRHDVPKTEDRLTPYAVYEKFPNRKTKVTVHLPNCVFPDYRPDGKPSHLITKLPNHPIAKDVPATFSLPGTEMYNEPFHVPVPDAVVFEERWEPGEWFRSGSLWQLGEGEVFYFRPGHETYPVYKQPVALKIVENAIRYLVND